MILGHLIHYDNLFACSTRGSLFFQKKSKNLAEIKRQHFLEKKGWEIGCLFVNILNTKWIKYPKINLKLLETKSKDYFIFSL